MFESGGFKVLVVGLAALLGAACGVTEPERAIVYTTFDALAVDRVEMNVNGIREWRDAAQPEPGKTYHFDLGKVTADTLVQVGVAQMGVSETPVSVAIQLDGETVESHTASHEDRWLDITTSLADVPRGGAQCTVVTRSETPYFISDLEVVEENSALPNVVIVMIDTLRQDHLGCYGYERNTSPNIDKLAADSILFTNLVPSSSWTRPSIASLLTSTHPHVHGAVDRGDRVREEVAWISELLADAGYETYGIVTNPNVLPYWNFGHGFARYVDAESSNPQKQDDATAIAEARRVVKNAQHPFMLYLHLMAPHEPYAPSPPFDTMFEGGNLMVPPAERRRVDRYDGEIAYCDQLLGQMMDDLASDGIYDSSLVLLLSDHGEEFGDHGDRGHGKTLYEEQLRVPFLVKLPGNAGAGEQRSGVVQMIDVAPSVLDLLGLPEAEQFQGKSFLPMIDEPDDKRANIAYSSLELDAHSARASKSASFKYIHDLAQDKELWYRLEDDPHERRPLLEPTEEHAELKRFLYTTEAIGASGLHVLVTHDSSRALKVSGAITGVDSEDDVQLQYPEERRTLTRNDDGVRFTVEMPYVADARKASAHWRQALDWDNHLLANNLRRFRRPVEQDYAKLVVNVSQDAKVGLSVEIDGAPVDASIVRLGDDERHEALDGSELELLSLAAAPHRYDPAGVDRATGVYVWYVPAVRSVSTDELTPELRESLEALGYIE